MKRVDEVDVLRAFPLPRPLPVIASAAKQSISPRDGPRGVAVAVLAQTGSRFRSWIEAIGLRRLTAFHVSRTPAALLFFWYGAHNWLPEAFVRDAGWGDVGAGIFALIVTLLPESRGRYLASISTASPIWW